MKPGEDTNYDLALNLHGAVQELDNAVQILQGRHPPQGSKEENALCACLAALIMVKVAQDNV